MSGAAKKRAAGDSAAPRSRLGLAIALLGIAGAGISAYLTSAHYQDLSTPCLPGMECDAVLTSAYAQLWGVPLSLFGVVMYVTVTILGVLLWVGAGKRQALVALGAYTIALSATLYSVYLYYLEIAEIGAFCTWCVASSLVVFSLMAVTVVNLVRSGAVGRSRES